MDATFHALANLFIEAIPTVIFFIVMTLFLKRTYFVPMARILEERRKATEGVRELAQKAFEAAEGKHAQFERALQEARNQMYAEHEALRCQWEDEQTAALAQARAEAEARLERDKRDLAGEVQRTESELQGQVDQLAEEIAASVLRGRAA
jgi:F-type H+-transporting ATPase subunit b